MGNWMSDRGGRLGGREIPEVTLSLHTGKGGYWWLFIKGSTTPQVGVLSPTDVKVHQLELP